MVFILALFEHWNDICQLPVDWDCSGFPGPLMDKCERAHNISQPLLSPGMSFISLHYPKCIQLQQQISKLTTALSIPESGSSSLGLSGDRGEGVKCLCFIFTPFCEVAKSQWFGGKGSTDPGLRGVLGCLELNCRWGHLKPPLCWEIWPRTGTCGCRETSLPW